MVYMGLDVLSKVVGFDHEDIKSWLILVFDQDHSSIVAVISFTSDVEDNPETSH